jgi:hypothetical protein
LTLHLKKTPKATSACGSTGYQYPKLIKTPWPCKVTQAIQANIWHPEKQHSSLQIYGIYESPQKEQSN